MPIYIESKGIGYIGDPFARHEYLVYIPAGKELDYTAWTTIGAYPTTPSVNNGSGSLLNAEFVNANLSDSKDTWTVNDFSNVPPGMDVSQLVAAGYGQQALAERQRQLVYAGADEAVVWGELMAAATAHDDIFTYKVVDIPLGDQIVWGPTVNSNSFITSILRDVSLMGRDIQAFETLLNEPGNKTWLGTSSNDTIDGNHYFAAGASVWAIYGAKGADFLTNEGSSSAITLVAGDDFDRDELRGGSGDDLLLGYFNQRDLNSSDILRGNGGADTFLILDPAWTLTGGVPDLSKGLDDAGSDFTHNGTVRGNGGRIDGGDGYDSVDFSYYVPGPVHLVIGDGSIQNVEDISLTEIGDDRVWVTFFDTDILINGNYGENYFSVRDYGSGIVISDVPYIPNAYSLQSSDTSHVLTLTDFHIYELTEHDDETDFRLFDGSGNKLNGGPRLKVFGGEGRDTIGGSGGHDDLHGGLGNDTLRGDDGADWLYDNGASRPFQDGDTADGYAALALAYDPLGNDTLFGGAGSDVLVYAGGTDTLYGGAGDDVYLVAPRAAQGGEPSDLSTVVVSGLGDQGGNAFGHDLIESSAGLDLVKLEGLNRSDVTITYSYTDAVVGTAAYNYDPLFWIFDPNTQEVTQHVTSGTVVITVNATGASVTIAGVNGVYYTGAEGMGTSGFEAQLLNGPLIEFDDGRLDRTTLGLLDPTTDYRSFVNSPLPPTAFDARDASGEERAVPDETVAGTDGVDDTLYGSNGADYADGRGGNDWIYVGAENDILIGGTGGDGLYGGSGSDTASYVTATSRISIQLFDTQYRAGDAVGDVLSSIENIQGSSYDDYIGGDGGANVLSGGSGNDSLNGNEGSDSLYGGGGADALDDLFGGGTRGSNYLDGGDGNDTLTARGGQDTLIGGAGDDALFTGGTIVSYLPDVWSWGSDSLDGGAGVDTATFEYQLGGQVIDMGTGRADLGTSGDYALFTGVENVTGSRGSDTIYGDGQGNVLRGDQGNDKLFGGAGNDTLWGGQGQDEAHGGFGVDTVRVEAARSGVSFAAAAGGILGTTSNGTIFIASDVEFIQFNDTTVSYSSIAGPLQTSFTIIDDFASVNEAATPTINVLGNDLPYNSVPLQLTQLNGQAVTTGSVVRLSSGATLTVLTNGQLQFDQGGAYAWLDAGESSTITFSYDATGGAGGPKTGTATLVVQGVASNPASIHLDGGAFITGADATVTAVDRIANFDIAHSVVVVNDVLIDPNALPAGVTLQETNGDTYIRFGDDAVVLEDVSLDAWRYLSAQRAAGAATNDTLNGMASADVLMGGAGNDKVNGNGGDDVVSGGIGNDTLTTTGGRDLILGEDGNDTVRAGASGDTLYGNAGNDELWGEVGNDVLYGGDGADGIYGGLGADSLFGGAGDDTFVGGEALTNGYTPASFASDGVDYIDGGDGRDRIQTLSTSLTSTTTGVLIDLEKGWFSIPEFGVDERLVSIEDAEGGNGNDTLIGSAGINTLYGGDGSDRIDGGAGNDVLDGGIGSNTQFGGVGDDVVFNRTGNDVVYGGDGNDYLRDDMGTSNDTIYGDAGNDRIEAGLGIDLIDGGSGTDTLDLLFAYGGVIDVDLTSGLLGVGQNADLLISIENVIGTSGSNVLRGNGVDNILDDGGAGNDALYGFGGNDTLQSGAGNDSLFGGDGDDFLYANTGTDTFDGGAGTDTFDTTFYTGALAVDLAAGTAKPVGTTTSEQVIGFENVISGSGNDSLLGTSGSNTLTSGAGNDVLQGQAGNDALYGGDGNDTQFGGDGDDILYGSLGQDSFDGGIGIDTIDLASSLVNTTVDLVAGSLNSVGSAVELATGFENAVTGVGNDTLLGTSGNNSLTGGAGNDLLQGQVGSDTLYGGDGLDTLDGGSGADTMVGGEGADVYYVDVAGDVVEENSLGGHDTVIASIAYVLGANLQNLTLTGAALTGSGNILANRLVGNALANQLQGLDGDDTLEGLEGNDTLDGGIGNDTLIGGLGADTMIGGAGDDAYIVDAVTDVITESANAGVDAVKSSISYTLGTEVENLTLTGSAALDGTGNARNNLLTGNAGANTLSASTGNDTLLGGDGDDYLDGGSGDDFMNGGIGNDTYVVGSATDVLDEGTGGGTDLVRSAVAWTLNAGFENLTLTGSAAIGGLGNASANTLTGNSGANSLSGLDGDDALDGGDGSDTLDGGIGNDSLIGGLGADTMIGGAGEDGYVIDDVADVVIEAANAGVDAVKSSISYTLGTEVENLTLTGSAALDGTGNARNNLLTGNAGANTLSASTGNDTLLGGDGDDYLDGGSGDDTLQGGNDDDSLGGGSGNDTLDGGSGNDILNGSAGADSMAGGVGDDVYYYDNAGDVVTEGAGQGTDRVNASIGVNLGVVASEVETLTLLGTTSIGGTGNALDNSMTGNVGDNALNGADGADSVNGGDGNDLLSGGNGNDTLLGGMGNDSLNGAAGNDLLNGGSGNDTFNGGGGNDTMLGSTGSDSFVFAGAFGTDTITGFSVADAAERIDLSGVSAITSFADLTADHLSQVGSDAVITSGANTITLEGILATSLTADDFIF